MQKLIRRTFSRKNLDTVIAQIYNAEQTDEQKALSAALGVLVGILPIWGFQTIVAIFLASVFKLNKVMVILFSQVSFPPLAPVIIFLSYRAGVYLSGNNIDKIDFSKRPSFSGIDSGIWQYLFGSVVLAILAAAITGLLTLGLLKLVKLIKQYRVAITLKKPLKQVNG